MSFRKYIRRFMNETYLDVFMRAKCLVGSRTFSLGEDKTDDVVMIPIASMFNHQSRNLPGTCKWAVENCNGNSESNNFNDVNNNDSTTLVVRTQDKLKKRKDSLMKWGL